MEYIKPFVSKMRKIGKGRGTLFPAHIYKYAELDEGDFVEIIVRKISPAEVEARKQAENQRQALNTEGKAAATEKGLDLSLVRVGVQDQVLPSSKEEYLSGKVPIPIGSESWAEQFVLGYPNRNLNNKVK